MNHTIYRINEKRPYFSPDGTKESRLDIRADGPYSLDMLGICVPSLKKEFSITNIMAAAAVYEKGGPYVDLYGTAPEKAREDERLKTSGALLSYQFEKQTYPSQPDDLFLIWLVFLALQENRMLSQKVCGYENFSCAFDERIAKAYCLYASLCVNGLIRKIHTFSELEAALYTVPVSVSVEQRPEDGPASSLSLRKPVRKRSFAIGEWIMHPKLGKGEIMKKDAKTYTVFFKVSGPKVLLRQFVEAQCRPL
ncbi:DUF6977 family protein [uncultured Dubosiella sp.]|uniref:DarT1-associated NADAR antitoxin family protein n=1 Tax=uncultured Dubosiella sp. TaxID=1937011 RepID=UPI002634B059|nr:hypothetical protein [uncultured Dubosiella sp.]